MRSAPMTLPPDGSSSFGTSPPRRKPLSDLTEHHLWVKKSEREIWIETSTDEIRSDDFAPGRLIVIRDVTAKKKTAVRSDRAPPLGEEIRTGNLDRDIDR